jgi:type I restriction enzyme S subunit
MKNTWQIKRLGEVCGYDKVQGIHHGLPYVGLENIESNTARFIGSLDPQPVKSATFKFSNEHVLYGRLRPYLNKAIAPDFEGHCSTEIFPIKPSPRLAKEYLLYWLLSDEVKDRINDTCTGARMPRADMTEVLEFEFPFPPREEQRRIVGILDEALDCIATAKANAEKNLLNARSLFDSYLYSVFVRRDSEWPITRLGDLSDQITDGTHNTPPLVDAGIPMLDSKHVKEGFEIDDTNPEKFIAPATDAILAKRCKPRAGDILISSRGSIGKIAIVRDGQDFNIMGNMILVRLPERVDRQFAAFYLYSRVSHIESIARGVAQKGLYLHQIRDYELPLPPQQKQIEIGKKLERFSIETRRLDTIYENKLAALDALKQSLLHQAFTGQL